MSAAIALGARVWFVSKFGDVVTGTYEGPTTAPYGDGERSGHLVKSHNAFGEDSADATMCLVFGVVHEIADEGVPS